MSISFHCNVCGNKLKAEPEQTGRRVKCTRCESVLVVPVSRAIPTALAAPRAIAAPVTLHEPETTRRPAVAVADDPPLNLRSRRNTEQDDIDMTPMIDVVFQLLIFFMVTATFGLQKSIEVPTPDASETAQRSRTIQELQEDEFVIVRVDHDDTIWVNDARAPSEFDMLAKLRTARQPPTGGGLGPNKMLVYASPEARHETVVRALDAGATVGMEDVRLATRDDDE